MQKIKQHRTEGGWGWGGGVIDKLGLKLIWPNYLQRYDNNLVISEFKGKERHSRLLVGGMQGC